MSIISEKMEYHPTDNDYKRNRQINSKTISFFFEKKLKNGYGTY